MGPQTVPLPGMMVPDFELSSPSGKQVQISSYRGRRNLVLLFLGSGDKGYGLMRGLLTQREELNEEETVVIVITNDELSSEFVLWGEKSPFIFLRDQDGSIGRLYGGVSSEGRSTSALYITDRYGEIYAAYHTSEGETLPSADEVLASLRHINLACPE